MNIYSIFNDIVLYLKNEYMNWANYLIADSGAIVSG